MLRGLLACASALLVSGCLHTGLLSESGSPTEGRLLVELAECPSGEKAVTRSPFAGTALLGIVAPIALEFAGSAAIAELEERKNEFSATSIGRTNVGTLYASVDVQRLTIAQACLTVTRNVMIDGEVRAGLQFRGRLVADQDGGSALKIVPESFVYGYPAARYDGDKPVKVAMTFSFKVISASKDDKGNAKVTEANAATVSIPEINVKPAPRREQAGQDGVVGESDWFVAPPSGPTTLTVTIVEDGEGKTAYERALKAARDLEPKLREFVLEQTGQKN